VVSTLGRAAPRSASPQRTTLHKTLRAELLTGRRFDTLAQAQQLLDAWVTDYNLRRPHQAIAMEHPHAPRPDHRRPH
jgi:transposase InsO family protein